LEAVLKGKRKKERIYGANSFPERLSPNVNEQIANTGTHANYVVLQYRDNKPTSLISSRTLFSYGLKKTDLLELQVRVGEAKVTSLQLSVKFVPNEEAYLYWSIFYCCF
jgi:hypothetical protein